MNYRLLLISLLVTFSIFPTIKSTAADSDWLIIGAGPAGIATVGVLLDIGISADPC